MKLSNSKYLEKIKYIDEMLDNEEMLNKYITSMENSKLETPLNMEESIKLKINNEQLNNKKSNNYKYLNILKIACFCLVVMITWTVMGNISINKNTKLDIEMESVKDNNNKGKIHAIYGKVNDFTNTFSSILLSPIEFKGGKK